MDKKLHFFALLFISFIYAMFVWLNKLMDIYLHQLNLSFLPNATYFIKVSSSNGTFFHSKLMVQH